MEVYQLNDDLRGLFAGVLTRTGLSVRAPPAPEYALQLRHVLHQLNACSYREPLHFVEDVKVLLRVGEAAIEAPATKQVSFRAFSIYVCIPFVCVTFNGRHRVGCDRLGDTQGDETATYRRECVC